MSNLKFRNEYPGLLTISTICKIIGIAFIVFAVIGFFSGIASHNDGSPMGVVLIFSSLLGGLLFSVPFFAFGELIKVFVRIEFNTRKNHAFQPQSLNDEKTSENSETITEVIPVIVSTSGSKVRFADNVETEVIKDADGQCFFVSSHGRHYYKSYNSAVNASYIYKKTKKISNIDMM